VKTPALGEEIDFEISEVGSSITILVNEQAIGRIVDI
jgi:hypothetical protein